MIERLTEIKIEYLYLGVWTDITPYVIGSIKGEWGLPGDSPLDRVAISGELTFTIFNQNKLFTPGLSTCFIGWSKGVKVKLTLTKEGESWIKFIGIVEELKINNNLDEDKTVEVTVLDWMATAAKTNLSGVNTTANQRIEQAVATIISTLPTRLQPATTTYETGLETFAYIFDSIRPNTKVLTELSKLARSELGYIYCRKDKNTGERLIVESRDTRNTNQLQEIPLLLSRSGKLLLTQGDYRLLSQGGKRTLYQRELFSFVNNMKDITPSYGDNIINSVTLRAYPRLIAGSTSVLFNLNSPMYLESGDSITVEGYYKDASGNFINADPTTMVTPVATTHYKFYQYSNGTPPDLTANLTVTPTFSPNKFKYLISNSGASGYVTFLTAVGYAISISSPIEYTIEDSVSISDNDFRGITIDQVYQTSVESGSKLAFLIIYQQKNARKIATQLNLLANQDTNSLVAFLSLDIGNLINITDIDNEINGSYYITRIGFEIMPGGLIYYWFNLQEALTSNTIFWSFDIPGQTEFGHLIIG